MQDSGSVAQKSLGRQSFRLSLIPLVCASFSLYGCGGTTDPVVLAPDTQCEQVTDTGSVVVGSGLPGDPGAPELASGYRAKNLV